MVKKQTYIILAVLVINFLQGQALECYQCNGSNCDVPKAEHVKKCSDSSESSTTESSTTESSTTERSTTDSSTTESSTTESSTSESSTSESSTSESSSSESTTPETTTETTETAPSVPTILTTPIPTETITTPTPTEPTTTPTPTEPAITTTTAEPTTTTTEVPVPTISPKSPNEFATGGYWCTKYKDGSHMSRQCEAASAIPDPLTYCDDKTDCKICNSDNCNASPKMRSTLTVVILAMILIKYLY